MTEAYSECPQTRGADAVERYLKGEMDPGERDAFEAHYFECDACWRQLRLGLETRSAFSRTGEDPDLRAGVDAPGPRRKGWVERAWPAVAAAAAVLLGVGVVRLGLLGDATSGGSPPGERRADGATFRGEAGATWRATAEREGGTLAVSWPAVEGVAVYRVRLFGSSGRLLLEREVADTSLVVDLRDVERGATGADPRLQVVALDPLREPLESTGLQRVEPSAGSP